MPAKESVTHRRKKDTLRAAEFTGESSVEGEARIGHNGIMRLSFGVATEADADAVAALRNASAAKLTAEYGQGPWSSNGTSRGVISDMRNAALLTARNGVDIVGTLRLARRKPWAIDPAYFTSVAKPVYLTSMAVDPSSQRQGVGRRLLEAAIDMARAWPGDAVRLDAFNAPAGAGDFYLKCGFREVGRVTYRNVPLIYFEFLL